MEHDVGKRQSDDVHDNQIQPHAYQAVLKGVASGNPFLVAVIRAAGRLPAGVARAQEQTVMSTIISAWELTLGLVMQRV